ncbi:MAG: hypothetical protein IPM06_21675 [Rhizobiales bacterium]|nr:hypothetical protein [Hyphomicrobiales bacterium]
MSTAVSVVPSNLQLPAHLQSPDIAAAIAAANAAATGGVRSGGFPSIGIKANKFSIKDGDETTVLMMAPAAAGQPPLPMMCLEIVVVDANPALSHTFFEGEYVEGEHLEPTCRSANGVTPDADVVAKQNPVCATCPQYAWGSKISKLTSKPVRACGDSKQLAVLPANDLNFKMLGLAVKAGSLKNWGSYVSALSGRGYGIATLVTNVTFDQTANGVLQFSFNRFLTEAEFIRVNERKTGDDVRLITAQSRGAAVPALAAPANLGLPAPDVAAPAYVAPAAATGQTGGFGASQITDPAYLAAQAAENARAHALAAAAATPAGPTAEAPFAGLEPHVQAAVTAVGGLETHAGLRTYQALTGIDFMELIRASAPAVQVTAPSPVTPPAAAAPAAEPAKRTRRTRAEMEAAKAAEAAAAPASTVHAITPPGIGDHVAAAPDLSHIPAEIRATIDVVGATSAAGQALIAAYPPPVQASAPAAQVTAPSPVTPPAAAAPSTGFGAAPQPAAQTAPSAQVVAAGASLAEKLRAKLGLAAAP